MTRHEVASNDLPADSDADSGIGEMDCEQDDMKIHSVWDIERNDSPEEHPDTPTMNGQRYSNYVSEPTLDLDHEHTGDSDSAIGGFSIMSSMMSVTPSIYQNIEENGRTYHSYKEGKYFLPNDEIERDRLDLQHALFGVTFHGNLYLAPIGEIHGRVLDIGTGTGIWAIDFASMHPMTRVIGTDLSAIQPEFVPANCHFEIDDAEDEWSFDAPFNYIHGRAMAFCFEDPASIIAKAFKALNPGGYLEMQDGILPMQYIGDAPTGSALYRWNGYIATASALAGRPWTNVKNYPQYFKDAGFEEIEVKKFFWPTNGWPKGRYLKTVARYFQQNLLDGIEGMSLKLFTHFLRWTREEVEEFLEEVKEDLKDKSIHAYAEISVVYGRKPL